MAPNDFVLFPHVKNILGSQRFPSTEKAWCFEKICVGGTKYLYRDNIKILFGFVQIRTPDTSELGYYTCF